MKKLLLFVSAFCMLFVVAVANIFILQSGLPVIAQAEVLYEDNYDELHWSLTNDGELTITGEGPMKDFTMYASAEWGNKALIKSVVIEEGVTTIGDYAFYNCASLTTIQLPSTLTKIGVSAFMNCAQLQSIRIPENVMRIATASSTQVRVFDGCTALKTVYVDSPTIFAGLTSREVMGGLIENAERILIQSDLTGSDAYLQHRFKYKDLVSVGGKTYYLYSSCEHVWETSVFDEQECGETVLLGCACTKCGVKTDILSTHVYDEQVAEEQFLAEKATVCGEKDTYYYSCICGDKGSEIFEYGDPLAHTYGDWHSNQDGTHTRVCGRDGNHTLTEDCMGGTATCNLAKTCEVCDEEYGAPLGHSFVMYVANGDETCTKDGTETAKCDREGCEETDTRTIVGSVLDHDFATEWSIDVETTCETPGSKSYH